MRTHGLLLGGACVAVAAASLLAPWALAFDPYAWLVWGREIAHGSLDTSAGPSWKPFPVLFTLPLSVLGEDGAPAAWLVIARTGALLAVAGAAVLAAQLASPGADRRHSGRFGYASLFAQPGRSRRGRPRRHVAPVAAGAAAALVLVVSPWWWFNAALGNSEGLLAAAVLWAAVAHLAGRERAALALLLAGSLLRPEVWPFLGVYGLWLLRERREASWLVAASFAAVPLLWFVPGALGGGGASEAAQGTPSAGSAGLADFPFLAVLGDAAELVTIPAVAAVLLALRHRVPRAVAAAAAGYVLIVAVLTQAGYAGNPRYLVPAAALGVAVAAAGAARTAPPLVAVLVVAVAAVTAGDLRTQTREVGVRADTRADLSWLPATRCPRVRTSVPQRSAVAWHLDLPLSGGLDAPPSPPAAVYRARPYAGGEPAPRTRPPFRSIARRGRWVVEVAGC